MNICIIGHGPCGTSAGSAITRALLSNGEFLKANHISLLVDDKTVEEVRASYPAVGVLSYSNQAEWYTLSQWRKGKYAPLVPFFIQKVACKLFGDTFRNGLKARRIKRLLRRQDKLGLDLALFLGDTENIRAKALCITKIKAKKFYLFQELPIINRHSFNERLDTNMLDAIYDSADKLLWRECDNDTLKKYAQKGIQVEFPLLDSVISCLDNKPKRESRERILSFFGAVDSRIRTPQFLFDNLSKTPNCQFHFYGNYNTKTLPPHNVFVHPPISYDEMRRVSAESDALFCIANDSTKTLAVDSKYLSYMSLGRPIVFIGRGYSTSFFHKLGEKYGSAYFCFDEQDFSELENWIADCQPCNLEENKDFFLRFTPRFFWETVLGTLRNA